MEGNSRGRKEIFKSARVFNNIVGAVNLKQFKLCECKSFPEWHVTDLDYWQGQGEEKLDMPCKALGFAAIGDREALKDFWSNGLSLSKPGTEVKW